MKQILIIFFLISILFGCSNQDTSKPDDVRSEIWENGFKFFQVFEKAVEEGRELTEDENYQFEKFLSKYEKDNSLTKTEGTIIGYLIALQIEINDVIIAKSNKDNTSINKNLQEYEEVAQYLRVIYKVK